MKVIILHGSYGKPFENWFPWAENKLSENGIECTIPTFPTPDYQNYNDWEELLDYYYKRGYINNQSILVGHSCGAVFIVKYLITRKIQVKGLITVSGYNNFESGDELMDGLNKTFYLPESDTNQIVALAERRISFYSDNDPFIPLGKLEEFAENIHADKIIINNAGHFNETAGYKTFEKIIEIIKMFA